MDCLLLDRQLQLEILTKLAEQYPNYYEYTNLQSDSLPYTKLLANIYYLQEHRLITTDSVLEQAYTGGEYCFYLSSGRITKDGLDLLANDGGLSAILNTVTVKLEEQQFRALIEQKIQQSDFSDEQKTGLIDSIKQLPSEGVKHLFTKLIDLGISQLPTLLD